MIASYAQRRPCILAAFEPVRFYLHHPSHQPLIGRTIVSVPLDAVSFYSLYHAGSKRLSVYMLSLLPGAANCGKQELDSPKSLRLGTLSDFGRGDLPLRFPRLVAITPAPTVPLSRRLDIPVSRWPESSCSACPVSPVGRRTVPWFSLP